MTQARIVILNYNGEAMLVKCLPSILEAVRCAKTPTAVTVLDNQSTDKSGGICSEEFSRSGVCGGAGKPGALLLQRLPQDYLGTHRDPSE